MKFGNRIRELFQRRSEVKPKSASVIKHDRLDDGILEDFRSRAGKFDAMFANAPKIPVNDGIPKECPSCNTDVPAWQPAEAIIDHGTGDEVSPATLACSACQHRLPVVEQNYANWSDLVSDSWRALYTYDEPTVKAESEVKPSHELHRRVMSRIINSEEFADTRPMTRMSEVESAFASMGMVSSLADSLREGALAEHAQRANELREQEQDIDNIEQQMEALREAFENGTLTDEQKQKLQDLMDAHAEAQASHDATCAQQQQAPIGVDVADAVDAAAKAGQEEAEVAAALPGVGDNSGERLTPDKAFDLADRWRNSAVLREVTAMIGRLERDMRYERANRITGGFEEMVDVEMGNSMPDLLGSEYLKVVVPVMQPEFVRRYYEASLMQYERAGSEPAGKGPLVVAIDASGSMGGNRNIWARAVALALTNIAHKERRDVALIEFSHSVTHEPWFFAGREPIAVDKVLEFAESFNGGGTDITRATECAAEIILGVPEFNKADLVYITDGEDYYGEEDAELRSMLQSKGVRCHGIAIDSGLRWLEQGCDFVTHVADIALSQDGGSNDATKSLAVNIT